MTIINKIIAVIKEATIIEPTTRTMAANLLSRKDFVKAEITSDVLTKNIIRYGNHKATQQPL